jgi:hypothetical protein
VSKDEYASLLRGRSVNNEMNIMTDEMLRLQGILKLDWLLYVSISTADMAWYYNQTQLCHPFKASAHTKISGISIHSIPFTYFN